MRAEFATEALNKPVYTDNMPSRNTSMKSETDVFATQSNALVDQACSMNTLSLDSHRALRRGWILVALLLTTLIAIGIVLLSDTFYQSLDIFLIKVIIAASSVGLAAIPIIITLTHPTLRERQLEKLFVFTETPIARTTYYRLAINQLRQQKIASLEVGYIAPLLILFFVLLLFTSMLLTAPWFQQYFNQSGYLLGGQMTTGAISTTSDSSKLIIHQREAFLCGMMAFVGSYVYMISRIWSRLNNNDIYPNSYHFYTVRTITAFLVAIVLFNSLTAFGLLGDTFGVPLGFTVGLSPDLFIIAIARHIYGKIKMFVFKEDPPKEARPAAMPLLMLNDPSSSKIDRLSELDIENAHTLARQNPFAIWPRIPYDLYLIIDWIGQAQLYALVGSTELEKMRKIAIQDIFQLHVRLSTEGASGQVCDALGIEDAAASALIAQLDGDPSFVHLRQVKDALLSWRPD